MMLSRQPTCAIILITTSLDRRNPSAKGVQLKAPAKHIYAFDLVRSSAIFFVFIHHILSKEQVGPIVKSITPGICIIGMSLLGFISAILLSNRITDYGSFLLRRISRIFIPLFLCLTVILILYSQVMEIRFTQQTLLHYLGLSGFFKIFDAANSAKIGYGLWFITAIIILYFTLPMLKYLFSHKNSTVHLLLFATFLSLLDLLMHGQEAAFNLSIGFAIGVYLQKPDRFQSLLSIKPIIYLPTAMLLLALNVLSIYEFFPFYVHKLLYLFYPFAFVPLFFKLSTCIPNIIMGFITIFAGLSYEFYILHFYFIDDKIYGRIISPQGAGEKILVGFIVTLALSFGISKAASFVRNYLESYLFKEIHSANQLPKHHRVTQDSKYYNRNKSSITM